MDGRKSALVFLSLTFLSGGCVTTTEKKVTIRTENEPPPPSLLPPAKEGPKQPVPPRVLSAFAEMKEKEAEAQKKSPEKQAQLRDEARLAYHELLKVEPDNIAAHRGLARVYIALHDYDRAADTYRKALAKHPRDINLWTDFGMMHNRRKEWKEAVECFRKALEVDPEHQATLKALGFTLARSGQIEQSLVYLTRATGSAASAHYNVAQMLLHLAELEPATRATREELARDHLRLALRENPSYDRARERLASLGEEAPPIHGTVEIQAVDPGH